MLKVHTKTDNFPVSAFTLLLSSPKIACIFGYAVSEEFAPHYFDLQCGIGSSKAPEPKINPFLSHAGFLLFDQWAKWRLACIRTDPPSAPLCALRELTHTLQTITATQNLDGLHRNLDFGHVYELYGCVLDTIEVETSHGLRVLPDVEMFGQNIKHETRQAFIESLTHTTLLIEVGCDERLHPYQELTFQQLSMPKVCLSHHALTFHHKNQAFKLNFHAFQSLIRKQPQFVKFEVKDLATAITGLLMLSGRYEEESE